MNALPISLCVGLTFLFLSVTNTYPTKSDPRPRPAKTYDDSGQDQDDYDSPSLRHTRQDGPAGGIVELTPFFGQFDTTEIDESRRRQRPPITKEELEREFINVEEAIRKAEQEKGEPLSQEDLENLKEKLKQKPWYRRMTTGISKFFKGIFGGRRKRQPDFLGTSSKEPGPPITKEEVQRELELVRQDVMEAEMLKGEPLNRRDLELFEQKLEGEPWYRRFKKGVSKYFTDVFGRRSKRVPDYLGLYN